MSKPFLEIYMAKILRVEAGLKYLFYVHFYILIVKFHRDYGIILYISNTKPIMELKLKDIKLLFVQAFLCLSVYWLPLWCLKCYLLVKYTEMSFRYFCYL